MIMYRVMRRCYAVANNVAPICFDDFTLRKHVMAEEKDSFIALNSFL